MLNIFVCIKPVPDVSIVSLNPETGVINADDTVYTTDRCDILNLEEAVRIKENTGDCRITLISVCHPSNVGNLRKCLAIGADEAMLVWDSSLKDIDSYTMGVIIAGAIGSAEYDLILCGEKASDTETGLVASIIAQRLRIPLISRMMHDIVIAEGGKVTAERKFDKGMIEKVEFTLPALVTMETDFIEPRYASLPSLMTALGKDIKQYDLKTLGLSITAVMKTRTVGLSVPVPRPKKVFTPDSQLTAEERKRLLLSGGAARKKETGGYLEGDPGAVASQVVKYLREKKMI